MSGGYFGTFIRCHLIIKTKLCYTTEGIIYARWPLLRICSFIFRSCLIIYYFRFLWFFWFYIFLLSYSEITFRTSMICSCYFRLCCLCWFMAFRSFSPWLLMPIWLTSLLAIAREQGTNRFGDYPVKYIFNEQLLANKHQRGWSSYHHSSNCANLAGQPESAHELVEGERQ